MKDPGFSPGLCSKKMQELLIPPSPPADKAQEMLLDIEVAPVPLSKVLESSRLPWVKAVCKHRDSLYSTVLCFKLDSGVEHCFAFLCATQSPYKVHLLGLERDQPVLPAVPPEPTPVAESLRGLPLQRWRVVNRRYLTDQELPVDADTEPFVAPFAAFRESGVVTSHATLGPLSLFVELEETSHKQPDETKKEKPVKAHTPDDELLQQYPFLPRCLKKPADRAAKTSPRHSWR